MGGVAAAGALLSPTLVTLAGPPLPRRGPALGEVGLIHDGAIAWKDGVITYAGPAAGLEGHSPRSLERGTVIPGFVDCHTHLPFFGWRAEEYSARLEGRTYRDLHGEGGIYRSARMLAEGSDEEVIEFCRPLLREMLEHGTTSLELKTGYGLSVDAELRQARLARRLAEGAEQTCTVTLLACHAIPPGMDRAAWVDAACRELIPRAEEEGLVDAVDVYVEDIAFTTDDLAAVAAAATAAGLPLRCHADQLGGTGAAEAACHLRARSADHLNHVSPEGMRALAGAETIGVLLPTSTFMLGLPAPPAGDLVKAGAAVALATDFNPGTSPVLSMPEAIAIGCSLYRLPPITALTAATANSASVLGLEHTVGSLEMGKRADFLVLDVESVEEVAYRPGHNPVLETWVGGERVWSRSG